MNPFKLTPVQLNVLFQLKKGITLHHITGIDSRWFLSNDYVALNFRTVYKLIDLGFIKETSEFHPKGILTEKGKEYLELMIK